MSSLASMVEGALARWPDLAYKKTGSRAEAAAQLVEDAQVTFLGELPSGLDVWEVNGHRCSHAGQSCDCYDHLAPLDDKLGRLCKHRMAVMFQIKLERAEYVRLEQIFAQAKNEVKLEVRVTYRGDLAYQVSRVCGLRIDEGDWQRMQLRDEEIQIRVAELGRMLHRHGWRVQVGSRVNVQRHAGGRERWVLEQVPDYERNPRDSVRIATRIDALYGLDMQTAEDQARRGRLENAFRVELAGGQAAAVLA